MVGRMTMMSTAASPPQAPPLPPPSPLPLRKIPGGYGWPVVGPISDRLDYFWFQGPETFFKKRMEKYRSTVFRTNVPPTFPFFTGVDPRVVAVLDCSAFAHLFDMDLVEKKNVLVGDYMPSLSYTGGQRVCAYLDTAETKHAQAKGFAFDILKRSSSIWVRTLCSNLDSMWDTIESKLSSSGSAAYFVPLQQFIFSFLTRCLIGADTAASPEIAESGYAMLDLWLAFQLLPTQKIGLLQPLEEIFLHSFAYPFILVKGGYDKLLRFVEKEGREVIQRGQDEFGLTREQTIHNLLFMLGFNAYGGFSVYLPGLLSTIGTDDGGLQEKLRQEVRSKTGGSALTFDSIKELELVHSFVCETLRLSPPVPIQYGRARKDFVLSSHDSAYEIKKGELLCGYQPLVMKDPNVFNDPDKLVADRFSGQAGRAKLDFLYWSNGPQTGSPSESNKQCAAKDYVTITACLFVAHLFRRYDSISCNSSGAVTALQRASS